MQTGASASAAYATALQLISGILEERATILAMQDAFWLSLALNGIALVAAFFVRFRKPQTIKAPEWTEGEALPETPGFEESMLHV